MAYDYWQKQDRSQPLFDDLIWSQPQRQSQAGKLLIVGGNIHSIAAPGEAYAIASQQGIGDCKVAMPDATRKLLGPKTSLGIEFVSSTPSGSFSRQAENDLKELISGADATLFAGDFSRSSETAILLEKIIKMPGLQIYVRDSTDYFREAPQALLLRQDTLLVLSLAELQKYAQNAHFNRAFASDMELLQLVESLHEFSLTKQSLIAVEHRGQIVTTFKGQVVSTGLGMTPKSWRLKTAAAAAVWWLQNPSKPLAAIATAISQLDYSN